MLCHLRRIYAYNQISFRSGEGEGISFRHQMEL